MPKKTETPEVPVVVDAEPVIVDIPEVPETPPMWVRYQQRKNMPAGAHVFGPLPSPTGPLKIRLEPNVWKKVNGEWAAALRKSKFGDWFQFSLKNPT